MAHLFCDAIVEPPLTIPFSLTTFTKPLQRYTMMRRTGSPRRRPVPKVFQVVDSGRTRGYHRCRDCGLYCGCDRYCDNGSGSDNGVDCALDRPRDCGSPTLAPIPTLVPTLRPIGPSSATAAPSVALWPGWLLLGHREQQLGHTQLQWRGQNTGCSDDVIVAVGVVVVCIDVCVIVRVVDRLMVLFL